MLDPVQVTLRLTSAGSELRLLLPRGLLAESGWWSYVRAGFDPQPPWERPRR